MITCTRSFSVDAGHRVFGHEGKCAHLHGHTYRIEVTARVVSLDHIGRVIDFSVLKERIGGWLDEHWDHGFIANEVDAGVCAAVSDLGSKLFVMSVNPTAENMADYLLREVSPCMLKGTGVEVCRVVVHETPNCFAEASL